MVRKEVCTYNVELFFTRLSFFLLSFCRVYFSRFCTFPKAPSQSILIMARLTSTLALLLGAVNNALGCTIPTTPLSNNITTLFSIKTQNPAIPRVHNYIMNFVRNGDDEHLVLRPAGRPTYDSLWLDNGLLRTRNIHAVIDLEVRHYLRMLTHQERLYTDCCCIVRRPNRYHETVYDRKKFPSSCSLPTGLRLRSGHRRTADSATACFSRNYSACARRPDRHS